jgi:NhaP-type Na+/H+ and K+/H+ antiporter
VASDRFCFKGGADVFYFLCRNNYTLLVIPIESGLTASWQPRRLTMCPFCLATMGVVVAGAVSTGGLAALVVKVSRRKNVAEEIASNLNHKEK